MLLKRLFYVTGGLFVVFLLVGVIGASLANKSGTNNGNATNTASPSLTATLSDLKLEFSWYKDADDTSMKANFTIKNEGNYAVKDVEIRCTHSAESGTVIDSNTRTIYKLFPAHKTLRVPDFPMGFINLQATASNCLIENFVPAN